MQPYLLPYIGYFQLIRAVDRFVVYDNIKYTKKGWINRNRILRNGAPVTVSVPLKHDSDLLDVRERHLAHDFDRGKLLNQIRGAYQAAPHFAEVFALLQGILAFEGQNLFAFLHHSLVQTCRYLDLQTPIVVSSSLPIDHAQRSTERIIAICRDLEATTYVNPIGGTELYAAADFAKWGIELKFLKTQEIEYRQFGAPFVPWLSILDVMMFNPVPVIQDWLATHYELIST